MRGGAAVALGAAAVLAACTGAPPDRAAAPALPAATAVQASTTEVPATVVQFVLETRASGEVVSWKVQDGSQGGTVTALRTFRGPDGFCRDYAVTVTVAEGEGGAWQSTACRDGQGYWHPASAFES